MEDEAPVARYDAATGRLRIQLMGGEEVAIGGLGSDLTFWCGGGDAPLTGPLWLTAQYADVLFKMVDYILSRVHTSQMRISPLSQQVLEELAPQLAQLRDELAAAGATTEPNASEAAAPEGD